MVSWHESVRVPFLLGGVVSLVLFGSGCRSCNTPRGGGGEVHGTVYTDVPDSTLSLGTHRFVIPDVTVFLKESSTSALSKKIETDLKGWYAIPHMPAGRYQLCWEADGYGSPW